MNKKQKRTRTGETVPEALINQKNLALPTLEEGDAGIILKKNGEFLLWNTHAAIDPENLTERQAEQARILAAFTAALRIPEIMAVLLDVASDPHIFGSTIDVGRKN
jgi:hypothetical protein